MKVIKRKIVLSDLFSFAVCNNCGSEKEKFNLVSDVTSRQFFCHQCNHINSINFPELDRFGRQLNKKAQKHEIRIVACDEIHHSSLRTFEDISYYWGLGSSLASTYWWKWVVERFEDGYDDNKYVSLWNREKLLFEKDDVEKSLKEWRYGMEYWKA